MVSYPRDIDGSVRRKSTTRQNARERQKDRKEQEKSKKSEEIERLKRIKQAEIVEKLAQIREITGHYAHTASLNEVDLDGEFDPDAYDAQMDQVRAPRQAPCRMLAPFRLWRARALTVFGLWLDSNRSSRAFIMHGAFAHVSAGVQ